MPRSRSPSRSRSRSRGREREKRQSGDGSRGRRRSASRSRSPARRDRSSRRRRRRRSRSASGSGSDASRRSSRSGSRRSRSGSPRHGGREDRSRRNRKDGRRGGSSDGGDSRERERERRRRRHEEKKERLRRHEVKKAAIEARKQDKERRRKEKQKAKESESATDKLKRRKEKKSKKADTHFGYTNEDNPFGDTSLHKQFVWKKKDKQEIKAGVRKAPESKNESKRRKMELLDEIERVKERRKQREVELEEREEKRQEEISRKEAELYEGWEQKEEDFHVTQARRRSKLRIAHGREKPIDIIAKNILLLLKEDNALVSDEAIHGDEVADDEAAVRAGAMDIELREPYLMFDGLPYSELVELNDEIRTYQDMMKDNDFLEFWDQMIIVCQYHMTVARDIEAKGSAAGSLHDTVFHDLDETFSSSSTKELDSMVGKTEERAAEASFAGNADSASYWKEALRQLTYHLAMRRLHDIHLDILERRLVHLERRIAEGEQVEAEAALASGEVEKPDEKAIADAAAHAEAGSLSPTLEPYGDADGSYSPRLEAGGAEGEDVIDADADRQLLLAQRARIQAGASVEELIDAAAGAGVGEERMGADGEVIVGRDGAYTWEDRYRPRKPRYFNRVKTGYDWNKYNQAHYDHDNPPPKTVQGYKFNIFYPDLIDKNDAPEFYLEPADTPDFAILRFHAGPPYEDVAFKIVNREWEKSRKQGYKCLFDRGVLQLYFNFKRMRYRS